MKFKAVVFDLDGVLCHTDKYHYIAWKQVADEIGVYFDEKINERLRGVSRADSLDIILQNADRVYTAKEKAELCERKNKIYVELLGEMSPSSVSDDVLSTLTFIKNSGLKTAIGSSSKNARLILGKLGIDGFFDGVSDGTVISHSKPHPEVFVKAADMIGERPLDCLVVEDAAAGIEAAVRGGFYSAGLGDAQNHPGVTYKINALSELKKIVTKAA